MPERVLLRGFYGHANLGDDVLALAARGWVARRWPEATVFAASTAEDPSYLLELIPGLAGVIRTDEPLDVDLTIDGGGGVFFGFEEGDAVDAWKARVAARLGARRVARARSAYRALRGRRGVAQGIRIGVGIGVGDFVSGSPRLPHALANMGELDALMVRDEASVQSAKRLRPDLEVRRGSDLAFAADLWGAPPPPPRGAQVGVGFVLRHWPYAGGDDYARHALDVARRLRADGVRVQCYALTPHTDGAVVDLMSELGPVHVWDPRTTGLGPFVTALASHELVVSARAHGAIIPAVLGVPSVLLDLEPKLSAVSAMLPASSSLVGLPLSPARLERCIREGLAQGETLRRAAREDAAANAARVHASLAALTSAVPGLS